jgi:hypothetical protein
MPCIPGECRVPRSFCGDAPLVGYSEVKTPVSEILNLRFARDPLGIDRKPQRSLQLPANLDCRVTLRAL